MLERLPPELIAVVAAYLRPSPMDLSRLELVSRSWFGIFSSQTFWGKVDPYFEENSRQAFINRVNAMPQAECTDLRVYWHGQPATGALNQENLDLLVAYHVYAKKAVCITNKAVALVGLNLTGKAYMVCSSELKQDPDIIAKVMAIDVRMVHEFPPEYLNQRRYIEPAVRVMGALIKFASPELQDDKALALLAVDNYEPARVRTRGYSPLRFLSNRLRNDRDVALKAVRRSGEALEYVSPELRNDPEITRAALEQTALALIYITECNSEQFLYALDRAEFAEEISLVLASCPHVRKSAHLITAAVAKFPHLLAIAPKELQARREAVLSAVSQKGAALQYAHFELQRDAEIVQAACRNDPRALKFAHKSFWQDQKLVLAAVSADSKLLKQARLFCNDAEIVAAAGELDEKSTTTDRAEPTAEWDIGKLMIAKGMGDLYAALNF